MALAIGRPTLRLSGVYLAMATLAFGEVVRIIILNTEEVTGGALGLNAIPQLTEWYDVARLLASRFMCFYDWRSRASAERCSPSPKMKPRLN